MLHFIVYTARFVLPLLLMLSTGMIVISGTQPPHRALAGFERCAYGGWCWLGIRPGVTTMREADRILLEAGYEHEKQLRYIAPEGSGLCNTGFLATADFEPIRALILACDEEDESVGDLVNFLGNPNGIGIPMPHYGGYHYLFDNLAFVFDNLVLVASSSLFDSTNTIIFMPMNDMYRVVEWENFTYYDYCRLEPETNGC